MLFTKQKFRKRHQRIHSTTINKHCFYISEAISFSIYFTHEAGKIIKILYYCSKVRIPIQQQQPLQRTVGSGGKPPPAPPRSPSHHTTPASKQRTRIVTTNSNNSSCREQWGAVGLGSGVVRSTVVVSQDGSLKRSNSMDTSYFDNSMN